MSTQKLVIWDNESLLFNKETVRLIGGKALGLHRLKSLGITVPAWATLTTLLFQCVCSSDKEIVKLLTGESEDHLKKAALLRERIRSIPIYGMERDILLDVWRKISLDGDRPVAVRSSAADEDSKLLSFAGQMDSFLNIRSEDKFLDAVRGCWASLFGDRAVLYRRNNNIDPWSPQIAVIVQLMIEADISGVIFSANPLTGNRQEMLVNSTWGLGEGLVAGTLEADTFIIDSQGNILKSYFAEKKQFTTYGAEGGTESRAVADDKQCAASLNEHQLKKLHGLALKVQDFKVMPMDIEFAVAEDVIYLLQARPITTLKEYVEPERDNFNVWDNSNIVESYSGVTTPLTFSFIRKAYFAVYWQFCEMIGVDKKTIFKNRRVFENMLGLIQGRVYYNLLNWYRLISLMPGFTYNKKFMEQMMGLQIIKDFAIIEEPKSKWEKYFVHLPKLLKVGFKIVSVHFSLQKRIAEFHAHFNKIYAQYSKLDYEKMTPAQILQVDHTLEDEVLWKWKTPILNDFEAMIFYGLLKKLTVKWKLDDEGTLQNDLLCGEGGIRSTSMTTELSYVTKKIEANEELKAIFLQNTPEEALLKLRTEPAFSDINREFNRYLDNYGVRSIDEMKLESISVKDNPVFCISMIQNYLHTSIPDPEKQQQHEQDIRAKAERVLKERLKTRNVLSFPIKLPLYKWVLKNTRNAIKNRENQRFARAEAYSLIRSMVKAVGKNWQAKGIIENVDDIFYLEIEEVWSFIGGTSTSTHLQKLINVRRQEFEAYRLSNPEDHIETYGEVYTNTNIFGKEIPREKEETLLKGLGCCRGIVEKKVQVIIKPDSSVRLNGEIMVAKQTDPGWVVLFPSVSGLIIEKGSMLSHSAIVAREMGIPTVVGVKNATRILRTGDTVRLNGATGDIKIVQRA